MPSNSEITSAHNPFFRHCLQLRDNRKRRRAGQFLIDGVVEIQRALNAGIEVQDFIVSPSCVDVDFGTIAEERSIPVRVLSDSLLSKLSYGQVHDQPIALAKIPELPLQALKLDSSSLVLVLDRTEKPGNLGACLRSAAACGVTAVILTDPICDPFNANAIRASRGTMFRVPLAICGRDELIQRAQELSLPVYAARVDAKDTLWDLSLDRGALLVFGNEAEGLSDDWQQQVVRDFTIPMSSVADSLNLSISAAVTLYEARRQRLGRKI